MGCNGSLLFYVAGVKLFCVTNCLMCFASVGCWFKPNDKTKKGHVIYLFISLNVSIGPFKNVAMTLLTILKHVRDGEGG